MIPRVVDHDFALWAFGRTWVDYLVYAADSIDLMHSWNNSHGHHFTLNDNDLLFQSMEKMKDIYKRTVEQSQ